MATSTIKSSGGDYTSLSAWEAAKQADITGLGPEIAECYDVDDTTLCGLNGWTTTASDYIEIKAATAARCNGSTRAQTTDTYRLSANNSSGTLQIAENYVRIDGIEIKSTGANPAIGLFSQSAGANDTRYTDLVITTGDGGTPSGGSAAMLLSTTNANVTVTNCLVSANRAALDTRSCNSATVDHCTFYGENGYGVLLDADTTVTNTYSGGHTTEDWITLFSAPSGSHNASADTSASTDFTSAVTSATASSQFTTVSMSDSTLDFSLKSGNSLEGAGTGSLTNDIAGNPYGSPSDIGCFAPVGGSTYTLTAGVTAYTVGGDNVNLTWDRVLRASVTSYTLGGDNVDLFYGRTLSSDVTAYLLGGDNVNLIYDRVLSASNTSYILGGDNVNLLLDRTLTADVTAYTLGGDSVNLTYTPVGAYILTADVTAYVVGGDVVNMLYSRVLSADVTAYTLGGDAVNLTLGIVETPDCPIWLQSAIVDAVFYNAAINSNNEYIVSFIDQNGLYATSIVDDYLGVYDDTYLNSPIDPDGLFLESILCR